MSLPKLDRNFKLVRDRYRDPEKYTWEALRRKYKFKSRNAPREIYLNFYPVFESRLKKVVDKAVQTS